MTTPIAPSPLAAPQLAVLQRAPERSDAVAPVPQAQNQAARSSNPGPAGSPPGRGRLLDIVV